MRKRNSILIAIICLIPFFSCGFGGGKPDDNNNNNQNSGTLNFPIGDGTIWTYSCRETGPDSNYTLRKIISGTRMFTRDPNPNAYVTPWFPDSSNWIRQYHSDSSFFLFDGNYIWMGKCDPTMVALRVDAFVPMRVMKLNYTVGDTFSTKIRKSAGIIQADIEFKIRISKKENVVVPAGSFPNCVRAEAELVVINGLTHTVDSTLSTLWFADSVGVVKRFDYYENRSNHTYYEELIDYEVVF